MYAIILLIITCHSSNDDISKTPLRRDLTSPRVGGVSSPKPPPIRTCMDDNNNVQLPPPALDNDEATPKYHPRRHEEPRQSTPPTRKHVYSPQSASIEFKPDEPKQEELSVVFKSLSQRPPEMVESRRHSQYPVFRSQLPTNRRGSTLLSQRPPAVVSTRSGLQRSVQAKYTENNQKNLNLITHRKRSKSPASKATIPDKVRPLISSKQQSDIHGKKASRSTGPNPALFVPRRFGSTSSARRVSSPPTLPTRALAANGTPSASRRSSPRAVSSFFLDRTRFKEPAISTKTRRSSAIAKPRDQ